MKVLRERLGPLICSWVPPRIWQWLLNIDLVIPHWHVVSDKELDHVRGLYRYRSSKEFKQDLEFFLRHYVPVNLEDVIDHIDGSKQLPRKCILLTFDDGFREISDIVAPILCQLGIPAVFFLVTSVVDNLDMCYPQKKSLLIRALVSTKLSHRAQEISKYLTKAGIAGPDLCSRVRSIGYRNRDILDKVGSLLECDFSAYTKSVQPYLSSEQIRGLIRRGFAIGAHSIDHPYYGELGIVEQLYQTKASLRWLSDRFQFACKAFAFPYSDADISEAFFEEAFLDGCLKVTFGIGGLVGNDCPRNLPRFSMERTEANAKQILSRQFGKAFLLK